MTASWKNPCVAEGRRLDFGHLGGTSTGGDPDSWFPELWDWLRTTFAVKSMLDVGCGVGYAMKWFYDQDIEVGGIDCQQVLAAHLLAPIEGRGVALWRHDLTTGPLDVTATEGAHDLVWCCEVAEHIDERLVGNLLYTLSINCGKVLAFCAAPRGAGGYHHVNCQDTAYRISLLEAAGLSYKPDLTELACGFCTAGNGRSPNNYFRRSGLIFTC